MFLDSDMLVVSEPAAFNSSEAVDLMVRPAHGGGVASGPEGPHPDFWAAFHRLFDIREPSTVQTTVDDQQVYTYWNTGLVWLRRGSGLSNAWMDAYERLVASGLVPAKFRYFSEQLSLVGASSAAETRQLPPSYNYPLPAHPVVVASHRLSDLGDAAIVHYHGLFRDAGLRNPLHAFPCRSSRFRELGEMVEEAGLYIDRLKHPRRILSATRSTIRNRLVRQLR